jgi:hypothetical protein
MTYKLTDERRKILTEKVLGECWHEVTIGYHDGMVSKCSCGARGCMARFECGKNNRLFTTDTDMMAVFRKLVDTGGWFTVNNCFWDYSFFNWREDRDNDQRDYSAWLFYNPERFCWLCSEWLKEVEK